MCICVCSIVLLDKLLVCDLTYRMQHFLTAQTWNCKLGEKKEILSKCILNNHSIFYVVNQYYVRLLKAKLQREDHQGVENISHDSARSQGQFVLKSQWQCVDTVNSPAA